MHEPCETTQEHLMHTQTLVCLTLILEETFGPRNPNCALLLLCFAFFPETLLHRDYTCSIYIHSSSFHSSFIQGTQEIHFGQSLTLINIWLFGQPWPKPIYLSKTLISINFNHHPLNIHQFHSYMAIQMKVLGRSFWIINLKSHGFIHKHGTWSS